MSYHFTPNMIPLALAALISGALGLYTWQHRRAIGAIPFVVMMLLVFEWELSYILHLAGNDFTTKLFWDKVMFFGVVATPLAWLTFALEYTGRKTWLNARRLVMLSIIPVTTLLIIRTNESHRLFWTQSTLSSEGGFSLLNNINGSWFWVHAWYSYILIMVGLVLIVRALSRWPAQYRGQMIWVLLATLTPFIANILTVFHIIPILIDLTPFAFTVTGIGMAFALFRYRLLDIAPIAREIVIDGMKDGMIILDAERRIVDVNRTAQEMIALTGEQQPIGKQLADILSDWPGLIDRYRNLMEAEDEISLNVGETPRWYALTLSTLLDENKLVIGRVLIIRDITDRKQAERQLQESETRFRQIVENASDLIYRVDRLGRITYANPSVVRVLGYDDEKEILDREYLNFVLPEFRHKVKRVYERQLLRKTPTTYYEVPVMAAPGHDIWLGQNVQLIYQGDQIEGFQAVARDITAIKQAYDALRIARDQALEASLAKTRLLSKVSHELRSPLGGIVGYAELLQRDAFGQLNEKQYKATSEIIESADYLANMVNELLDEAQLRSSNATLQEKMFSPRQLVQQATSGMDILAQKKGLSFSSSIDPRLPEAILGDDRRLRQIIINLLGNAIKFTKAGSISLEVTCPENDCWAIRVTDTGMGISKEAQSYIFEPFRQLQSAVTYDNRGVGLGLSITKQLVELMNGKIVVESETGRGSTFTVLLPLRTTG
jgi:PAS domain S-box-containing protein